jgi:hypothetical protein
MGLPSTFPFGVTTLKALLDSPGTVAPPGRVAAVSLSSLRSPALDEATLAGRTRPVAGELEGAGSCRDFTVILKSSGIGAGTDTSIASIQVQTFDKKPVTSAPCITLSSRSPVFGLYEQTFSDSQSHWYQLFLINRWSQPHTWRKVRRDNWRTREMRQFLVYGMSNDNCHVHSAIGHTHIQLFPNREFPFFSKVRHYITTRQLHKYMFLPNRFRA